MAFEDFLNHKCDIYHLTKSEESPGYALPASPVFGYPDSPDISGAACHFGAHSLSSGTDQQAPQNLLVEKIKLTLPADTDIRINDKVVDCASEFEYTAEKPVKVRKHHIFVYIKRTSAQEAF